MPDRPLAIDIEVVVDEGRPYVTGYSVRTTVPTDKNGSPKVRVEDDGRVSSSPWKLGSTFRPVSLRARDLRQLRLADFAAAARAQAADPLGAEGAARALRALSRKRPRDRGTGFYDHLLELNKSKTPAEIARELGEDPGQVRVWLYRARKRKQRRT